MERESAAQRDVIWVCDFVLLRGLKLPLLCLLFHIYRYIGLIEKRQHEVQRGDSFLPLGVKQRWTSTYFSIVHRRKYPINTTSLCNALAVWRPGSCIQQQVQKQRQFYCLPVSARLSALHEPLNFYRSRAFEFLSVSQRNVYERKEQKGYIF
jgi:hypothetical protein